MGKKFMGLGGTDHFWDRAKAWILNQITSAVAAKIAEVVANAPEDLDTLKEIADWIKNHANDAAAMNTQITENKNNIAALSDDAAAMNTQITENKSNIAALSDDAAAMNTQIIKNQDDIKLLQNKIVESCPVDVVEDGNMHTVTSNAVAKEIQDVMHSNIYIPNPTYNGISYVIPRYKVQSIKEVSGVPVEGKTIKIKFKLYVYASKYEIQLSYGTTDAVIQQMSGVGRTWFTEVNNSDTDYVIDDAWKIYEKSITITQGNTFFGIGTDIDIGIQSITIA